VIFATVGTHAQPFTRFLSALASLEDDVIVQYGHNPPPEGVSEASVLSGTISPLLLRT